MSKFDGHTPGPWTFDHQTKCVLGPDGLFIGEGDQYEPDTALQTYAPVLLYLCIRQNDMIERLQKVCSDAQGVDHCGACSKNSGYTDGTCKSNEIVDEVEEVLK